MVGEHNPASPPEPGMPRWVKVSGIVTLAVLVLLVLVVVFGGEHGPGRHLGAGGAMVSPIDQSRQ